LWFLALFINRTILVKPKLSTSLYPSGGLKGTEVSDGCK
jgi:hypothetical protein